MSEQDQSVSGTPNEIISDNSSEVKNDTVAYNTYRKAVEKEKTIRDRANSLQSELDAYKQKELESQGRHEDVISGLRDRVNILENENKETKGNFIVQTVDGAIARELALRGCNYIEDSLGHVTSEDYSTLEVDDKFNVQSENIKFIADKLQQKRPDWFKSKAVSVSDSAPTSKISAPTKVDFSKMTTKEVMDYGIKLESQNKLK